MQMNILMEEGCMQRTSNASRLH